MKIPFLLIVLSLVLTTNLKSQDGNGRLLETLLRGLAHVVTSENGSSLVPPPIPYDSRAGHSHQQQPAPQYQDQGSPNRGWFQPNQPQAQPAPRVVQPTPQPRVIRQQPVQPRNPASPFSGWYQAPPQQPQPQYYEPTPQVHPNPASPFSGFNPFQNQAPQQHVPDYHDHLSQQSSQPGLFGQRQPQQPSHHSRDDHHDHGSHRESEQQRVIAIRSQFQPFTIFQGQRNQSVISSRSVRPVPNQRSIVWFKTR